MKIAKVKEKEVLALFVIICAIILIGYFQLLIRPKMKALGNLSPKVAGLKRDIELAENAIANIENFKKRIATLGAEVASYEDKLPARKDTALILGHLSKIAKDLGVKIVEIKELKEAEVGKAPGARRLYDEALIGINMKAGYHQLGRFINRVETETPLMKIHDIQIKADPKSPREHNAKLIVSAFILAKEGT